MAVSKIKQLKYHLNINIDIVLGVFFCLAGGAVCAVDGCVPFGVKRSNDGR